MIPSRSPRASITLFLLCSCDAAEEAAPSRLPDTNWEVVATSAGETKIAAIKVIREVTGVGLAQAKDLVDNVPSVIVSGVSKKRAETAAGKLRAAGMTVRVESR